MYVGARRTGGYNRHSSYDSSIPPQKAPPMHARHTTYLSIKRFVIVMFWTLAAGATWAGAEQREIDTP